MTIKTGEKIPPLTLYVMTDGGPKPVSTDDLLNGKKVVLFALPGAFTPTCSASHLPGYVVHADAIKEKGVDTIICLSVNDPFVMDAWGKSQNADGQVLMLADGNCEFTRAVGLEMDGSGVGMGPRSQRYSMIIEDGTVTALNVEQPREFKVSSAEAILKQL